MSSITINLPDDSISKINEKAHQLGITPEELIRASIEEFINQPDDKFKKSLDYVLNKNKELYKRLA